MSGRFQKEVEQYMSRGIRVWPLLVRTANQLTFSMCNQIGTSPSPSILVGQNGALFQPMYLRSFNRSRPVKKEDAVRAAQRLRKLENRLRERGVPLVLMISPNAIALSPEIVPSSLTDPTRLSRENSYERALPHFKKAGIPIIDFFDYAASHRGEFHGGVFPLTGSHWNDYASCIATQQLLTTIGGRQTEDQKRWPSISCDNIAWSHPPPSEDTDLLDIANLLFPARYMREGITVTHKAELNQKSMGLKPKMFLVGTSFLFAIQNHLERSQAVEEASLFFYAKSIRRTSKDRLRALPLTRVPWDDIWKYDAVVLEINQASLTGAGHGFVKAALDALKKEN